MVWSYYAYILANVGISVGILAIITVILIFFIKKYDIVFDKIVKLMFYIEMHNISKNNEKKDKNTSRRSAIVQAVTTTPVQAFTEPSGSVAQITITTVPNESIERPPRRKLLDLYGKIIDGDRRRNIVILIIITVAIFGTICIAFIQGCCLATITIYPNGPCPSYGLMDCYGDADNNYNYFTCKPGDETNSTQFNTSAACFRWIARDISINDAVTQLGACAGLLHALCALVQLALRFLIYSGSRRLQTPEEAEAEAAAATDPETPKDKQKLKYVWEHPRLIICACTCMFGIPCAALIIGVVLGAFKISTTALTYVILVAISLVFTITIAWVVQTEEEGDNDPQLALDVQRFREIQARKGNKDGEQGLSQVTEGFSVEDIKPAVNALLNRK
ncbi:unnamed protein product [Adineta steineri]|uniref:Uncharacterized protein n=1 Tax=Adineta steineri TaxID=433720 RepID=A0A819N4V1_9BILA|nr:unnamed protein product [Adineta steineri]CAF3991214.1 unnamed protein product [Adineta steineri]